MFVSMATKYCYFTIHSWVTPATFLPVSHPCVPSITASPSSFDPSVFILLSWPASRSPSPLLRSSRRSISLFLSPCFSPSPSLSLHFYFPIPICSSFIIELRGFGGLPACALAVSQDPINTVNLFSPPSFCTKWETTPLTSTLVTFSPVCKWRLDGAGSQGKKSIVRAIIFPSRMINMLSQLGFELK